MVKARFVHIPFVRNSGRSASGSRFKLQAFLATLLSTALVFGGTTAFMLLSSGWMLSVHYCPTSQERVVSLIGSNDCGPGEQAPVLDACCMPAASEVLSATASCCETQAPDLEATDSCPERLADHGCCIDQTLQLSVEDPYAPTNAPEWSSIVSSNWTPVSLPFSALSEADQNYFQRQRPPPLSNLPHALDRCVSLQVFRS